MEKVIRDGMVAIIISPGYGAGWQTWNKEHIELLFSPKIVEMIELKKCKEIDQDWIAENLGITGVYCGGAENLEIIWLPIGTKFRLDEYDGYESITTEKNLNITA